MNIDFNSFTEKSAFAMQEAQNLARQNGQQEIDTWHLLIALVQQEGGIVPSLLERMQISPSAVELEAVKAEARQRYARTGNRRQGSVPSFSRNDRPKGPWDK